MSYHKIVKIHSRIPTAESDATESNDSKSRNLNIEKKLKVTLVQMIYAVSLLTLRWLFQSILKKQDDTFFR